jgi:uncharacterized membrane protein YagU involved in acid resistance
MQAPFYNFEHEDIQFAALVNHQMINSIIEFIGYIMPRVFPVLQLFASIYIGWHLTHILGVPAIAKQLWGLFTPGQQYSEIIYVMSSLLVTVSTLYVCIDMLRRLERHLSHLKEQRKELQDHVEELEKENEEMKATFRLMVSYANPNVMQRKRVKQIKN